EFTVNGDVDLSVGHISFKGFVDIKGDVLDDFNISATKGINITGAVGACQINSDGPVTVGTMAGMGTGKIICKGTLQARYLNQITVECWGDVNISHEVRNAVIKSTGSINVPTGLVTGGELVALEGVEVKILGARAGAKTNVTSGVYFPETDRLKYLRNQIKTLVDQTKRIGTTLNTLNKRPGTEQRKALREATELRIGILTQRQVNLEEEREELAEELLNFTTDEHPTEKPQINILSALKEGTSIELGETNDVIETEISGPVSIVENTEQGGFRYLTYSPLKVDTEKIGGETPSEGHAKTA
ncbi:MAG: FapA family protein, partial [Thermodesulfobacteriota bacterium]|nr:FapA family protein [Thermodesulfobacteriota bacterium]